MYKFKLYKSLFFLILINSLYAQTGLKHKDFKEFGPFGRTGNSDMTLSNWGKLKGRVYKIIYERPEIIFGIEYDYNGNLLFSRFFSEESRIREEVIGQYDKKGNYIEDKVFCYANHDNFGFAKPYDTVYQRRFQIRDLDKNKSYLAFVEYKDDIVRSIDGEVLDFNENKRINIYLDFDIRQNYVKIRNVEEKIPQLFSLNGLNLIHELEIIMTAQYKEINYDKAKNNQIIAIKELEIDENGEYITKDMPFIYLSENVIFDEHYKRKYIVKDDVLHLVLSDEASLLKDEVFKYDKNGNWINREYLLKNEDGRFDKIKEKRHIEYWE